MDAYQSYVEAERKGHKKQRRVARLNFLAIGFFVLGAGVGLHLALRFANLWFLIGGLLVGWLASLAPKVVNQWERAVVLRLGRFHADLKHGLHFIIPLVERVAYWIDQRVQTTSFRAEKTLTKDTVPVDVDAVLFWVVWDAKKAALEVADYHAAISWAAQTALREIIGRTQLSHLLASREKLDEQLQHVIDDRTEPWGITVQSVEIRDVVIPELLQDAMSRQAQAERERQARVILGEAEKQIATKFAEASRVYENNPVAMHLRAMNMLYEGLKEKSSLVIVPSTAVESMGLGALAGLTALTGSPALKNTD